MKRGVKKEVKIVSLEIENLKEAFETEEDRAEFLTDAAMEALQTGDASILSNAISVLVKMAGASDVSKKTGLSRATLYQLPSSEGKKRKTTSNPTMGTILPILSHLGLRMEFHPVSHK